MNSLNNYNDLKPIGATNQNDSTKRTSEFLNLPLTKKQTLDDGRQLAMREMFDGLPKIQQSETEEQHEDKDKIEEW